MIHNILRHTEKSACKNTHAAGTRTAEQAAAELGLGAEAASRALRVPAHGMACCMRIIHDMKNDACMPGSVHSNYMPLCATALRARACGARSFSATAKPFDLKQKLKGEHTFRLKSCAVYLPCRTPCSALTVAADDRYR